MDSNNASDSENRAELPATSVPPTATPPLAPDQPAAPVPPEPPGLFQRLVVLGAGVLEAAEALFRWLTAYPLFLGQLIVLLLVAWGGLGANLGAEHLFWHERPFIQLGTGITVGLFVGVLLFLIYLLFRPVWLVGSYPPDPKHPGILHRFPGTLIPSADAEVKLFGRFLLWGMVLVLAVLVVPKFVAAASATPAAGIGEDDVAPAGSAWKDYLSDRLWLLPFIGGYVLASLFARVVYYFDEGRMQKTGRPALRDRVLDLRIIPPSIRAPHGAPWDTVRQYLLERDYTPIPKEIAPLHGIAALVMVVAVFILCALLGVVYAADHLVPGFPVTGLVSLVCLIFIVLSLLYGFFEFHFRIQRLTLIVFGGALLVWNSTDFFKDEDEDGKSNYKLQFPGLEGAHVGGDVNLPLWDRTKKMGGRDIEAVLDATSDYAAAYLIPADEPLQEMYARWQEKHPGERPKIAIICTSGGGIRAAVWTGVVLNELEKDNGLPEFRTHLRLITGASGGMVGATLYVADFDNNNFGEKHIDALAADSLTRTGQSLVLRDMVWNTVFVPPWRHADWDRGRTLEWMWELNSRGLKPAGVADADWRNPWTKTFADLRVLERRGLRPSLIYSPLLVEDSRRLLISNLELSGLNDPTGLSDVSTATGPLSPSRSGDPDESPNRSKSDGPAGRSAVEFHRLFPDLAIEEFREEFPPGALSKKPRREVVEKLRSSAHFKVVTAARMNATFPVISPAVSLPTAPPRRVVDAGLYDNYGVNIAALWLLKNKDAVLKYTSGVALIQVRAFPLHDARNRFASFDPDTGQLSAKPPQGDLLADILASASAPAEALLAARANAAFYRNAEQLEVLHRAFNTGPPDALATNQFFYTAWLELRRPAALNWYLTSTEREAIKTGYTGEVLKQHAQLRAWYGTGGKKVAP